jgi:hypothetical protein
MRFKKEVLCKREEVYMCEERYFDDILLATGAGAVDEGNKMFC